MSLVCKNISKTFRLFHGSVTKYFHGRAIAEINLVRSARYDLES